MTVATIGVRCALVLLAVFTALNLFAEGEPKMPTLNWMGREKATKAVKEVGNPPYQVVAGAAGGLKLQSSDQGLRRWSVRWWRK